MTEKEYLKIQIRSYEFYADLIASSVEEIGDKLPRWNGEKIQQYRRLVEEYKQRLAAIEDTEQQISVE
jgi:hypothetical protein